MNFRFFRAAFLLAAVMVAVGALAGMTSAAGPQAAPGPMAPNQPMVCAWEQFDTLSRSNAFAGGAYNGAPHTWVIYGGMNTNENAVNDALQINFPDANINNAVGGMASGATGAKDLFGPAAASLGTMLWFIGGGETDGSATNFVQTYDMSGPAGAWNGSAAVNGAFNDRVFAAAVGAPDQNVVIVNGGAEGCTSAVPPEDAADDCIAGNFTGSSYIKFDVGGAASWDKLTGGPNRLYGHTMVYDSMGKRALVYGGTDDGARGKTGVMALNLSDPDITKATWSNLATAGTSPADRYFHSATYDPTKNWMIIYGGVRSNAFAANESALQDTWALDLNQTPPRWMDLGATQSSSSVGSVMTFDSATGMAVLQGGRRQGSTNNTANAYALSCTAAPTATPTRTPGGNTSVPPTPGGGTNPPPLPTATLDPNNGLAACAFLTGRVPNAAINEAVANPAKVSGYNTLCFPNVPPSPYNQLRNKLSLRNPAVPYHPMYNGLVWSCGCP